MVVQGRAPPSLLESYEAERISFARKLVETTDAAFSGVVAQGLKGSLTRRVLLPLVFLIGGKINFARHLLFRTISQIEIEYEDSDLSGGKAGHVKAGDRLPWAVDLDNFAPLSSLDWQVHVYGEASELQRRALQTPVAGRESTRNSPNRSSAEPKRNVSDEIGWAFAEEAQGWIGLR